MAVLIYGMGAIGSVLAACLSTKADIIAIARRNTVKVVSTEGLDVIPPDSDTPENYHFPIYSSTRSIPDDLTSSIDTVFITTKSYDAVEAFADVSGHLSPRRIVLFMNGLGIEDGIESCNIPVYRAAVGMGAYTQSPGRVHWTGRGNTFIGPVSSSEMDGAEYLCELLSSIGIPSVASPAIEEKIWQKTIANCAINPVTALTRCTNGRILEDEGLEKLSQGICLEGVSVYNTIKGNTPMDPSKIWEYVRSVIKATARNRSSMLMDVLGSRKTEIDYMNGYIVYLADKMGVPTPLNHALYALIKNLETY